MEQTLKLRRITLIDDDPITNMVNTKLLTRANNFHVTAYTNAQKALSYLGDLAASTPDQIPEVIFLDINMPIMDGWEFLEEFQNLPGIILEQCKVIILTSSIDLDDIEKSKKFPAVKSFVSKPLTMELITSLIREDFR